MEDLLRSWDGQSVILQLDRPSGAWIIIAIHSTILGPAAGGTRMKSYASLDSAVEDAQRLASAMTLKFALSGLPIGGGKAVIATPATFDAAGRGDLLRRYGVLVSELRGLFRPGPDVGTSSEDMDVIAQTAGSLVHSRTAASGGAGDSGPATALGVYSAMQVVCDRLFGTSELHGRKVLVQGAGSVGARLLEQLLDAGAHVLFSDVNAKAIRGIQARFGIESVEPEEVYGTACDVFAPCALGGILDAKSVESLRCKAIVGAANNPLVSPDIADQLNARGILYAPDFVVNFGGAMAITGMESLGWTSEVARERVVQAIQQTLRQVLDRAKLEGTNTDVAARQIAAERLIGASRAGVPR